MPEEKLRYIELDGEDDRGSGDAEIVSLVDQLIQERPEPTPSPRAREEGDEGPAGAGIDPRDRPQLDELYRQIIYQYLDPIAQFIRLVRSGDRSKKVLRNFRALLDPIMQLTETLEARTQFDIVEALARHIEGLIDHRGPFTYRHLEPLNVHFDDLLNSLGSEIREKYLSTCYYLRNTNPLLEEIRRVRYIGPRRLQRLYTVGLVTVEAISRSTAEEIREVTGISIALAQEVINVTRAYMVRERENRRQRLRGLCRELATELSLLTPADRDLYDGIDQSFDALLPEMTRVRSWLEQTAG